jgi:predicted  nucleic acid-binding Zn-ribbon protein
MPLGALAGAAFKAMLDLYDRKYGKTPKMIKQLKKDLYQAEEKIADLRTTVIQFVHENAVLRETSRQLNSEVKHWSAKFAELADLAMAPAPLEDNPYEDEDATP